MRRALRDNGATAVSVAATLMLLRRVVTPILSLSFEVKPLALSLLRASMYLLQRVLVGKRPTLAHWFVQYGAWAAYYLPAPIAFSAASAFYYSTTHVDEYTTQMLLVGILVMLIATKNPSSSRVGFTNMRAYSLRDRPRGGYNFLMWLVHFLMCPQISLNVDNLAFMFLFAGFILFGTTSESTLDCQTKQVADYMKQLLKKSSKSSTGSPSTSPFFDDDDANSSVQMDYCRYPFMEREDGEWVTLKGLVQLDDLSNEDQDIWLSYSLSQLLARRYYGFHCAEEGDDKVRRFALAGLGTADGYKRAFTIVEVQLAFLHDYFFTNSLPIVIKSEFGGNYGYIDFAVSFTSFTFTIQCFLPATLVPTRHRLVNTINLILVERVPSMYMGWCQLFGMPMSLLVKNLLPSYWRPIHTAFRKINGLPEPEAASRRTMRGIIRNLLSRASPNPNDLFQTQTDGAYWRNKIGQYSILQDYDRARSPKKALEDWFNTNMLSQPSYEEFKHLPVEEEEVDMQELDNMRELIANTLWGIDGPPTNGTRSLKINMGSCGYDWSWTCRQETHTHTILIWHIATSYCGMTPPHSYRHDSLRLVEIDTWYEVATALSRYCAYLVAFLPDFLPEHSLTTKQVFQGVIRGVQHVLGTEPMKEEEKRIKIQGLQLPDPHEQWATFHKGIMLGRELEKVNTRLRWKVMAEFWAETILYVAPSDNAEAHIEHLAKGGEFITHLWAMLSNAGILKRATGEWQPPPASTTTEGPSRHQLTETLSPSVPSVDEASTSSMSFVPRHTSEPTTSEKGKQPQIMDDID